MKRLIAMVAMVVLAIPMLAQPPVLFPNIEFQRRPTDSFTEVFFPDRSPLVLSAACVCTCPVQSFACS
jgi:hypothetical protein